MTRAFLQPEDVHDLVVDQFGADRRLAALDRLTGGSKKGVYRLCLDDTTTVVLYVWSAEENYWGPSRVVPDDPFTDASGLDLFAVNHAALSGAGVRVPELLMLDRDGRHLGVEIALVEDAGSVRLEALMERDPAAAATPLAALGGALRSMHTTIGPRYGKLADIARDQASQSRPAEDIIVERALRHLEGAAAREGRLADAYHRIITHLRTLRAAVTPRTTYGLVHGELGPDHVLVTPAGEAVVIDFEGLTYFDIEWDHAWLEMRFETAYPALQPVDVDPGRLALYRFAQVLSLIDGPLRIADTDFPDREWMLALAGWNVEKALAAVSSPERPAHP